MIIKIEMYQAAMDAIQKRLTEMGKEDSANDVLKKAINNTASLGKKLIYNGVLADYAFKEGVFEKKDITRRGATSKRMEAVLRVKGTTLKAYSNYQNEPNDEVSGARLMILRSGSMKELGLKSNGRNYKAFVTTMKNRKKETGEIVEHRGIFQRVPGERMKQEKKCEKIREIIALSKAKAAEMTYRRHGIYTELQSEMSFRLLKHMNAVIGDMK